MRRAAVAAAAIAFIPLAFIYWFAARFAAEIFAYSIVGDCYSAADPIRCLHDSRNIEVVGLAVAGTLYAGLLCWGVRRLRRRKPDGTPE